MPPKRSRFRSVLRIFVIGFAVTLLAGYVAFSQFAKMRRAASGSKSTRILEGLRIIDPAIDQPSSEAKKNVNMVTLPGSKSAGVFPVVVTGGPLQIGPTPAPAPEPQTQHFSSPGSKALVPVIDGRDLKIDSGVLKALVPGQKQPQPQEPESK